MAGIPAGTLSINIVAEIARLQSDLDKAKRAVASASGDIAKSARHANDNLAGIGKGAGEMGKSTRLAGHHVQNLTFQLNDMFVGLASGQKPMTVFMQQGAQIGQIMQMAGVGLAGFVKELALMLVPFSPIIAALAALGVGVAVVTAELNENSKVHLTWMDVVLGTYDAVVASIKGGLTGALKGYGIVSADVFKSVWEYAKTAFNAIYGIGTLVPRTLAQAWSTLPQAVGQAAVAAANAAIRAMNGLMKGAVDGINAYIVKINAAIAAVNNITGSSFGMLPTLTAPQVNQIANQFAGAGVKFGAAMGKAVTDTFSRDYIGEAAQFVQPFAEARARKRLAEVGGKGGKDAGAAAGKAAGEELAKSDEIAKAMEKLLFQATMDAVKAASALLAENLAKDWADFEKRLNKPFDESAKAIQDAAQEQADWNDELSRTVAMMGQLGRLGGTLGGILQGLNTGDFSGIGGKTGGLLTMLSGVQWTGTKDGERYVYKLGEEFNNALKSIFGEGFGGKLLDVFKGAAIGSAVGGIIGGGKNAQVGASLGGALGSALGEKFLSKGLETISKGLGQAAGPLGAIAGALLGGVLGSLLKKAKTGSATIGVVGGNLSVTGVAGNSNSRKAASTQGANSVIDALSQIANAFGASLGTANVSVGMRDNKYRVDTTGAGRTKGAGVLNFGKDSEAALKAAIADAISDGVFIGMSAGVERLLKNGDVEKQLQKALSFQSVFDDLAAAEDPAKAAAEAITKWRASMAKIFEEAGATAEELAKLETLTGIKRVEAAEAAAQALLEKERPYREANIQIMQLEGKVTEALAAQRQLELDGMEEGLRPLYQRIHALQDEAETAAKLAELTAQRHELETQLLEILDPVAGARAREADALAALDPSLQALMQSIWDAKVATDAAAEATRVAKEVADERNGLETQWLQLIGDTNALRARERDGIGATNLALYDQIIAEQDRLVAVEAATKAIQDAAEALKGVMAIVDKRRDLTIELARLLDPAAAQVLERADALRTMDPSLRDLQQQVWNTTDSINSMNDALAKQKAIADERAGLMEQFWQVTGDTASIRAAQLAKLDESNRQLQKEIWAYTDAQDAAKAASEAATKAETDRADALGALRDRMMQAYDREAGALQSTIDKMGGFISSIGELRDGLIGGKAGAAMAASRFRATSQMAQFGDEGALGRFGGDAQGYLDSAKGGTEAQYRRALADVLRGSNAALQGAGGVASEAQRQLDEMKRLVGAQESGNEAFETFASLYSQYQTALTNDTIPAVAETVSAGLQANTAAVETQTDALSAKMDLMNAALIGMAGKLASMETVNRTTWDGDRIRVVIDNSASEAVPVDQV